MTGRDIPAAFPTGSAAFTDAAGSKVMPTTKMIMDLEDEDEEEEEEEEGSEGMTRVVTLHDEMEGGIAVRRDSIKVS